MRRIIACGLLVAGATACGSAPPDATGSDGSLRADGPVVALTSGAPDNRSPSVAADGSHVAIVWAATADGVTDIYAAVSDDGGASFQAPVRVNDIPGDARVNGEQPPVISMDGDDVAVVWQSRRTGRSEVRIARSSDRGRSFTPAQTVHAAGFEGARGWASVALDATGAAHVSWLDTRLSAAAKPAVPAAAGAVSTGGHVHSAATRQDVYHAVLPARGEPLEKLVTTDVCFCCKTGTAIAPDGTVYVAFRHIFPGSLRDMAVARSDDGGHTFRTPARVHEDGWELTGCPEDGPAIAVDSRGAVHIAWPTITDARAERKGVFYSVSTDGARTFGPRVRLDDNGDTGFAQHPRVTASADGIAVVWDESSAEGPRVRMRIVRPSSSDALAMPPLTLSEPGPVTHPAIAATDDGFLAAWVSITADGSVIHTRRIASSKTF